MNGVRFLHCRPHSLAAFSRLAFSHAFTPAPISVHIYAHAHTKALASTPTPMNKTQGVLEAADYDIHRILLRFDDQSDFKSFEELVLGMTSQRRGRTRAVSPGCTPCV